jgi:autotransporter translocation and assembly factor TamB
VVALVNISNGDIRYVDKKEGADLQARQIDLGVEDFDFDRPVSVKLAAALFADKQNVKLAGKIGPLGSVVDFTDVPLDGEIDIDALDLTRLNKAMPMLKRALPKELDLSGVFSVKKLKFAGKLKDLALNGEIDGTRGALRYGAAFQKAAGIPLTLTTDARYAGDKLEMRKGRLTLHTLKLDAAGDIQLGDAAHLNLSLDSEPAALDGWEKIFPAIASYQLTGTTAVKATVQGKAGKGAMPKIQGTLDLKGASARPPGFPKAIENLDTSIRFTGQKADIKDMTLTLGQATIRLAAAIDQFAPLALSYKLSAPELWPADYHAALPEDRKADVIRNVTSEGRFAMTGGTMVYQGKLASGDGTLYNVAYKNLDASLSLADDVAQIRSLRINALSGAVQADGEYSFKDPEPRFSLATKFQGVDLKELYAALDAKAAHDIRGRLNADMRLIGGGKTWEEIKPALRGQGEAEVAEGALLNFNIAEGALGGITGNTGTHQCLQSRR